MPHRTSVQIPAAVASAVIFALVSFRVAPQCGHIFRLQSDYQPTLLMHLVRLADKRTSGADSPEQTQQSAY